MGKEGDGFLKKKKRIIFKKKNLLWGYKVKLYHHLHLYNTFTYVGPNLFFLKMVKNHLFDLKAV